MSSTFGGARSSAELPVVVCWSAPLESNQAVYSSPLPRFIRPSRTPVLTPDTLRGRIGALGET